VTSLYLSYTYIHPTVPARLAALTAWQWWTHSSSLSRQTDEDLRTGSPGCV